MCGVQRWRDLVIETDPDIIIGYNICNFDLPYLIKRAETLKVHDFPYWGRNRKMCAPIPSLSTVEHFQLGIAACIYSGNPFI